MPESRCCIFPSVVFAGPYTGIAVQHCRGASLHTEIADHKVMHAQWVQAQPRRRTIFGGQQQTLLEGIISAADEAF